MKKTIAVLLCLLFASSAFAGVMIVSESKSGNKTSTDKIYIEKDRFRADSRGQTIIFRSDKNLIWIIDQAKKTYRQMTKADFDKMAAAMKKMQAQLKQLPAAQRQMMEKMMAKQMGAAKQVKTTYKKLASGQKVGKWKTTKYAVLRKSKKVATLWTTKWNNLKLSANDFKVFENFSQLMANEFSQASNLSYKAFSKGSGLDGIPVKRVSGKSTWVLKELKKKSLAKSLFALPKGLKKTQVF